MEAQKKGVRVRDCTLAIMLATAFALQTVTWSAPALAAAAGGPGEAAASEKVKSTLYKGPLSFEANQGQTDQRVKYLSRGRGYALFLTSNEAVLSLQAIANQPRQRAGKSPGSTSSVTTGKAFWNVLRVKLQGANPSPAAIGIDHLPGRVNYFVGRDSRQWRTNIPTYAEVRYSNVYPGIDLTYHSSNQGQLEYDFVVRAGSDVGVIELAFAGAENMRLNPNGDLIIKLQNGELVEHVPAIYQEIDGRRRSISGGYQLTDRNRVAFKLAAYDKRKPLVIDPTLVYSTTLGGGEFESSISVAADCCGHAYVTGVTNSSDFPTTAGVIGPEPNGSFPAFVTKYSRDGKELEYSTYLGGDVSNPSVSVDTQGCAYVFGQSLSSFPTTNDTPAPAGGGDGLFVAKLDPTASHLLYAVRFGGSGFDWSKGSALDGEGHLYVTGYTESKDFPHTPNAFQPMLGGPVNAFVAKLDPVSNRWIYSSYLGGNGGQFGGDLGLGIAVDGLGDAFVAGTTGSTNFPGVRNNAFQSQLHGFTDGFVTKINSNGTAILYSTYIGGGASDRSDAVAVDQLGNAYVAGATESSDFPASKGAFQTSFRGNTDAFVVKVVPDGSGVAYSTYLGGSDQDDVNPADDKFSGIAVDDQGRAYVAGGTQSPDFPTTAEAFQSSLRGPADAFITQLSASGSQLLFSTFLGGYGLDYARGVGFDSRGGLYVVGETRSQDFPTTEGAFQSGGGSQDVFVTKIQFEPPIIVAPASGSTATGAVAIEIQRNTGVKWLNVYVDGTYLASSPPFTFSWDSSKYAGGEHQISAIAYGYDNQVSGNDEVTVTASNPAVRIDQPAQGSSVSGIVTIDTERTHDVAWLNVYIDGRYLASSPPFSFKWNSAKVPNGTHSISAKGYRGAGTLLGSTSLTVQVKN